MAFENTTAPPGNNFSYLTVCGELGSEFQGCECPGSGEAFWVGRKAQAACHQAHPELVGGRRCVSRVHIGIDTRRMPR